MQFVEFHESVKKKLRGNAELYRERKEEEKWSAYQTAMIEHLDEVMENLMQTIIQQMGTFAIKQLKPLQGMSSFRKTVNVCILNNYIVTEVKNSQFMNS